MIFLEVHALAQNSKTIPAVSLQRKETTVVMIRRRLWGKQSGVPKNLSMWPKLLLVFEWLAEFLSLQIFRMLPVAKCCSQLLDGRHHNLWIRVLQQDIVPNHFKAPDAMCRALSSRIPPKLQSLSVNMRAFQRASDAAIEESWQLMLTWFQPSFKKLDLAFSPGVSKQIFKVLFKTLPRGLEELSLDFEEVGALGRVLHPLSTKISAMQCLQQLNLTFNEAEDTNSIKLLLSKFPSTVSKLEVCIGVHHLDNSDVRRTFAQSLSQLSKLTDLSLHLLADHEIPSPGFHVPVASGAMVGDLLRGINHRLKSFWLQFFGCLIPRGSLETLLTILAKQQPHLEKLNLLLTGFCQYESVPHLVLPPGLQIFDLEITNAEDIGFVSITSTSLRSLRISVFDSEWSTESFYGLLHQLPSNLQSLHFEIDSTSLREVGAVGAVVFPPGLKELRFHALDPPMSGCAGHSLKRKVVKALAEAVLQLTQLQYLAVRFSSEDTKLHGKQIQEWATNWTNWKWDEIW